MGGHCGALPAHSDGAGKPYCNHGLCSQPHAYLILCLFFPLWPVSLFHAWTLQQTNSAAAKVSLTAPLCVCVCCHEGECRPAALILLASDGSGASCYSWRAGKLSIANCVCVFVCLRVIGDSSHIDKKTPTAVSVCAFTTHTHTCSKDKKHQPPAAERDLFHDQIFRASNMSDLPCELHSAAVQKAGIYIIVYF